MDTTTTARNTFATRLYDKLASTQAGENLFLSPFSIQVALAMCAVGCHRAPQSRPHLSAPKLGRGMDVHGRLLRAATTLYGLF